MNNNTVSTAYSTSSVSANVAPTAPARRRQTRTTSIARWGAALLAGGWLALGQGVAAHAAPPVPTAKASAKPAATTAIPDVRGTYVVDWTCLTVCQGVWAHSMTIATLDTQTGAFTGTGYFLGDPTVAWTASGKV